MSNYDLSENQSIRYEEINDYFKDCNYEGVYGYFEDLTQYVPRIEGTEFIIGIAFSNLNYSHILTNCNDGRKLNTIYLILSKFGKQLSRI